MAASRSAKTPHNSGSDLQALADSNKQQQQGEVVLRRKKSELSLETPIPRANESGILSAHPSLAPEGGPSPPHPLSLTQIQTCDIFQHPIIHALIIIVLY